MDDESAHDDGKGEDEDDRAQESEYKTLSVYEEAWYKSDRSRAEEDNHLFWEQDVKDLRGTVIEEASPLTLETRERVKQWQLKLFINKMKAIMRPTSSSAQKLLLATFVKVGGLEAWVLWDTGSSTTGVTPSFAAAAKLTVHPLDAPMNVQLGTTGSRSSITYGLHTQVITHGSVSNEYLDVVNFDCYDMVIGIPFIRKHKVVVDVANEQVIINGKPIKALPVLVGDDDLRLCRYRSEPCTKPDMVKHKVAE
jgi:hypothetical protein